MLQSKELTRYSRNILLDGIGREGQEKLKNSRIAIMGMGGLGCPSALYLSAAGVGEIHLFDYDTVDLTNLQRQILYSTNDLGMKKSSAAMEKLQSLNPEIKIIPHEVRLDRENIRDAIGGMTLVLEGSDNFETKFLVNDACVLMKVPLLVAGILRYEGQLLGIHSQTPCYRCTFLEIPDSKSIPNCAEAGVLGSTAGVIGSLQASEALKYLVGGTSELFGKILICDLKSMEFRKLSRKKNPLCPICGENPKYKDLLHHSLQLPECKI